MTWVRSVPAILKLGRVHMVVAGFVLFTLGTLFAVYSGAPFDTRRFLLGYLVLLPAHLAMHYSNDYFDAEVDRFGQPTRFTGGSGVLASAPQLRPAAKRLSVTLMLCSLALTVLFIVTFSFPAWLFGYALLGNLLGWFYAAPPLRLAYRGLGEISTTFTIGLLIPGLGYIITMGSLGPSFWFLALPMLCYGLAFIFTVQIPDMEADRLGGKHTMVSRIGRRAGFIWAGVAYTAATVCFLFLSLLVPGWGQIFLVLAFLSLIPSAAGLLGLNRRPEDRRAAIPLVNAMLTGLVGFVVLADVYMVHFLSR